MWNHMLHGGVEGVFLSAEQTFQQLSKHSNKMMIEPRCSSEEQF